jgi:small ligand-binding sensory domain FIST
MPSRPATSTLRDTRTAAHELAERLERSVGPHAPAALLLVASFHHRAALPEAFDLLRATLRPEAAVAITAVGVIGEGRLYEGVPAMAALLLDEPGLEASAVRIAPDDGPPATWDERRRAFLLSGGLQRGEEPPSEVLTLLWADPFSSDPPGLAAIGGTGLVHGGVLSGSSQAGGNLLITARRHERAEVSAEGAAGLALRNARAAPISAPGARPVGSSVIVTASDGTRLLGLGGRPAIEVLREVLEASGDLESLEGDAPMGGLAIGIAIDEHRPDGREPTCRLRPLTGFVRPSGASNRDSPPALRLAEPIRPGRTVRFFMRDPEWAAETFRTRLLERGMDLQTAPAAVSAVSTARAFESSATTIDDRDEASRPRPLEFGGPCGVGIRTAGEFVQLGGRAEIDTLAASVLCFEGPPSLA